MIKSTINTSGAGLEALLLQIAEAFFQLRRLGMKVGTFSSKGGGTWGLLRLLATDGPKAVPEIAARQGVSRQHIQVTANELVDRKLVRFVKNPAHKRSKLLSITAKGKAHLSRMSQQLRQELVGLLDDIDVKNVDQLTSTLRTLTSRLEAHLGPPNTKDSA